MRTAGEATGSASGRKPGRKLADDGSAAETVLQPAISYSSTGTAHTQAVKFAQCMRANRNELARSEQQRTPIPQPDRSELAHFPDGVHRLSKGRAERPTRAARTDSRPTARRAHVRPMHATHGFPQFPDPLTTYRPGLTLGKGEYFPLNSTTDFQTPSPAFRQQQRPAECRFPQARRSLPAEQHLTWTPPRRRQRNRRNAARSSRPSTRRMDPLWSPAVASAGKRSKLEGLENPLETARSFAAGCHRSPWARHGKEGVDGSSPSEGLQKVPASGVFSCLICKRKSRAGTRGLALMFARGSHGTPGLGLTTPLEPQLTTSLRLRGVAWPVCPSRAPATRSMLW